MALKGTLRDFGLADIFQLIGIQRKTGVLALKSGERSVSVSFLSGAVVSAESSERALEDRLGSVLVKSGKVTDKQLSDALKVQRSTLKRLGNVLIEQKAITPVDLREALRVQVTQIVYHLFRWRDAEYDFSQEETIDYDREFFTPIPAENILMEGARMIDEWPIIERRIRDFKMILRRKGAAGAAAGDTGPVSIFETDIDFDLIGTEGEDERVRLSRDEALIYRMVDGRSSVQDIIDRAQVGEFEACRILYELMNRDLVEEGMVGLGPIESPRAPLAQSILLRGGLLLLPILAVVSMLYSFKSPLSPVGGGAAHDPFGVERIRGHLSQARVGRIDRALRLFYLDRQSLPATLDVLVGEGFLTGGDLVDPWGRAYEFQISPSGYSIIGYDPEGQPDPSVTVQSLFAATERLTLEGGSPTRSEAPRGEAATEP